MPRKLSASADNELSLLAIKQSSGAISMKKHDYKM